MDVAFMNEIKQVGQLTDADRQLLMEMRPALVKHASAVVEAFYTHLEQFAHLSKLLHAEPGRVERLKNHLQQWLLSLADGEYGEAYFNRRYRIGFRHVEVGLEPRYVIAAMTFCRATAARLIVEAEYANDPQKAARMVALNRMMDIDLNVMLQSYDDHRVQQFLEVTGFSKALFETLMAG
ncbi:MAG TPA: protoglobin domain-containing protein [Anaerolineae bacterium]|nr:protoglobin domain-containing protein [Anaerolineae bacterium]HQI84225.1 protoglobin domain-containing protein [Anaerolineae bacterium]